MSVILSSHMEHIESYGVRHRFDLPIITTYLPSELIIERLIATLFPLNPTVRSVITMMSSHSILHETILVPPFP